MEHDHTPPYVHRIQQPPSASRALAHVPLVPREATGAYQISESQGPLTPAERAAKQARRMARREHASAFLDEQQSRRRGERPTPHPTLTDEDLVEAQQLVHERIRAGEVQYRAGLRKKCSSITDLAAAVLPTAVDITTTKVG